MRKIEPRIRGSSHGSIINYKNGRSEPPLEILHHTADLLNVSRRWLVDGEGEMDAEADRLLQLAEEEDGSEAATWDLVEEMVKGAALPPEFRAPAILELFGAALRRRLEIESAARGVLDEPPPGANEILAWADELEEAVARPWGLDLLAESRPGVSALSPHEFTAHAVATLSAILGAVAAPGARSMVRTSREEEPDQ